MVNDMAERVVGAAEAARKIEEQQRDLTEMIGKLIKLRNQSVTGKLVAWFENGKIVKAGFKKD